MAENLDLSELKKELRSLVLDIESYVEESFPEVYADGFDAEDVSDLEKIMEHPDFSPDMVDDFDRTISLLGLRAQLSDGFDGWDALIHEDNLEDYYGENYALDCYDGDTIKAMSFYIDWDLFVKDMTRDMTEIDFDGETYYTNG